MIYRIRFKNDVCNRSDVVGWNIETGEAGVWSGLFGNPAYFPLRRSATQFLRILNNKGIDTTNMIIVREC